MGIHDIQGVIRSNMHLNSYVASVDNNYLVGNSKYERSRYCVVTCTKEKSLTIPATGYSLVERTTLTRAYLSQLALVTCLEEGLQQRTGSPSTKSTVTFVILFPLDLTLIRRYSFTSTECEIEISEISNKVCKMECRLSVIPKVQLTLFLVDVKRIKKNKIQKKSAFVKSRLVDVDKTLNEDKKEEGKSKVDNQKEKW
ncbi:hypothetical protein HZH66_003775 [Vespula vulgaris]|uniref:Uncharacterized protein n=1 Tax=Vespula vulgaris TaxID=7454 RepID=A0A834NE85_VESVU|nr:hypothetical protein HZH66_003775 [Vespula vulgaris]